jgi:hypothetical protein
MHHFIIYSKFKKIKLSKIQILHSKKFLINNINKQLRKINIISHTCLLLEISIPHFRISKGVIPFRSLIIALFWSRALRWIYIVSEQHFDNLRRYKIWFFSETHYYNWH